MMKCESCRKEMPDNPFEGMEDEDGLEGYAARNLPQAAKAWCISECIQRGKIQ